MNNDYKLEHDGALWHLYHKTSDKWTQLPVGSARKSTMWEQYLRIVDYNEEPWK